MIYYDISLGVTRQGRIIDVVYNASNNELVRTKTLVKNCIITIDATPFRQWYEAHFRKALGRKKVREMRIPVNFPFEYWKIIFKNWD